MPSIRIEAENYRKIAGGFYDSTVGNQGTAKNFTDSVDVSAVSSASGGYYVLGDATGDWLTYDVNITQAGQYQIVPRVASAATNPMSLKVTIGGQSQQISISNTGGWSAWKDFASAPIALNAGQQTLRIDITGAGFNFDSFDLVLVSSSSSAPPPSPTLNLGTSVTASAVNGNYGGGDTIDYSKVSNLKSGIKINLASRMVTPAQMLKLMPTGDSITFGLDKDGTGNIGAYRNNLETLLKANGNSIDFVGPNNWGNAGYDNDQAGFPSWRIDQIANGGGPILFPQALQGTSDPGAINTWLSNYSPDAVLLMIGTNDIVQQFDLANATTRLSNLIDQITNQSPQTQVLVASIAPMVRANNASANIQVNNFNSQLPGIVSQKKSAGKNVSFVDVNSVLSTSTADLPDGVHPSSAANVRIAQTWYNAIDSVYNGRENGFKNVIGTTFDDTIIGDASNNIINGSSGNDILTGGGGQDIFVLAPQTGSARITDFSLTDDRIALSNGLTSSALSIIGSSNGLDTLINYSNRTIATLSGIQASAFTTASPFMTVT
jgi:hypothetical protein